MEDLRKNINTNNEKKVNILSPISSIFNFIRTKWRTFLFWIVVIFVLNIIFNPRNTAEFLSSWYNSFVITIIENTN